MFETRPPLSRPSPKFEILGFLALITNLILHVILLLPVATFCPAWSLCFCTSRPIFGIKVEELSLATLFASWVGSFASWLIYDALRRLLRHPSCESFSITLCVAI